MHEMVLDAGDGERPRAWHVAAPGTAEPLCGVPIDPVAPAHVSERDDGALHCAECLAAYAALVTAG
ncbi:hypothetical protein [Streptodolium elevatio]|uniref:Zinc-finger domain-containing protein n=1 Tax=Streptodolium elevatio TaxID=3157996 RepID=A0ABV3DPZ5_9ACTN